MSDDSVLLVLQRELETIQQNLRGLSPVVQVLGLSSGMIENILPVLFPSVTFVSAIGNRDCVGIHATVTVGVQNNSCYTTWSLRLDENRLLKSHSTRDIVPQAIQWLVQQGGELF